MHCARGIAPGWGSRRKGDEIEHCERVSVGIELARYIADSRDQLDANAIIFGERGKGEPVLGASAELDDVSSIPPLMASPLIGNGSVLGFIAA